MTEIQFTSMAADSWFWKTGNLRVGNFFSNAQFGEDMVESAAQHDGEIGSQRRNFFQERGGSFRIG